MVKIVVAAVVALVIGLLIGFFAGRALLEKQWSQPYDTVSARQYEKSSRDNADPTPPANTKVLEPMPIGRSRKVVRQMTEKDPVVVLVAAEGSGDNGVDLHVVVENHAKCSVKEVSGVAYGFDAKGRPAKMNKAGEPYVAFKGDFTKEPIEPGKHATVEQKLAYVDVATNGVAHVDAYTCADGSSWRRQ